VSVISGRTRAVTATIPVGAQPFQVDTDPVTRTAYVANFGSNTVSVISERSGTVTATVPVGAQPFGVRADPLTNTVYVSNSGASTVSVISGKSAGRTEAPAAARRSAVKAG
jgi:YVTN family beta-propeller protein